MRKEGIVFQGTRRDSEGRNFRLAEAPVTGLLNFTEFNALALGARQRSPQKFLCVVHFPFLSSLNSSNKSKPRACPFGLLSQPRQNPFSHSPCQQGVRCLPGKEERDPQGSFDWGTPRPSQHLLGGSALQVPEAALPALPTSTRAASAR